MMAGSKLPKLLPQEIQVYGYLNAGIGSRLASSSSSSSSRKT